MKAAVLTSFFFVLLCLTAQATDKVVYVDCDAPGPDHDGTSWDTAFSTIQQGVDVAGYGGQVWVANGEYTENVHMHGGVAMCGGFLGAEPGGYETELSQRNFARNITVINGNRRGCCVSLWTGAADVRVDGFRLTNGDDAYGGGVKCLDFGAGSAIVNNTIVGNFADHGGGGVWCSAAWPIIANNIIAGNIAQFGGGIGCERTSPTLTNNTIALNTAAGDYAYGGGIYCSGSSAFAANNIVASNSAKFGGGIYSKYTQPKLSHNDFWGNTPDDYYGCEPGEGDMSADPLFSDPWEWDFHLLPESPCIDAGDNEAPGLLRLDFEGELRILDGDGDEEALVDIGADEFSPGGHVVTIIDLPAADAEVCEDSPLEFAGTAYETGGGEIVGYLWTFGEGSGVPDSHEEDPGDVAYPEPGTYVAAFNAQAEDGDWCPLPDTRTVTVLAVLPEAVIDQPESDLVIDVGDYVEFAGTATDANGEIVGWLWTFGEGSGISDQEVEDPGPLQFNNPGVFEVTFTAQDNDGHWAEEPDTRTIYVAAWEQVYVDCDSPGPEHDGLTWDTAFLTIQDAVDAAGPNGEVWVADGTYVENVVMAEGVAIYGGFLGAEPGGYETELCQRDFEQNVTTIDGNQWDSCVIMAVAARVDGFTITNGVGTADDQGSSGGGVFCDGTSSYGAIANNTITGNSAYRGGGICCRRGSSPEIADNIIRGNTGRYGGRGGGICCTESSPAITGNTITENTAGKHGGGIHLIDGSSPTIALNTISGNIADEQTGYGGGIFCRNGSSPTVTGNTISGNSANNGAGICCSTGCDAVLTGNTISENTGRNFGCGGAIYCVESSLTVTGNLVADNTGYDGGGIYCIDCPEVVLVENEVVRNSAYDCGGGVCCRDATDVWIDSNVIRGNVADWGAGIYCKGSSAVIAGNMIAENSAKRYTQSSGGGLLSGGCTGIVCGNVIAGNFAWSSGGGIECGGMQPVYGNIISGNTALGGGAGVSIYNEGIVPCLANNTITGNWTPTDGGGIGIWWKSSAWLANNIVAANEAGGDGGGIYANRMATVELSHNDVWGNLPEDYHGCEPGEGDISADPEFVDTEAGDFHLKGGSPCIDSGDNSVPDLPETDWDSEDRIAGGTVDIGADEFFTWTATAPDPQPECDGPLFGEPQAGFPGWIWFSIPMTPAESADPNDVLGFACNGKLHRYDKYRKAPVAYQPPFSDWDLSVGDSYLLWLENPVTNPSYEGLSPFCPWTREFELGRQGWTWIGMPGSVEMPGEEFMEAIRVVYPSDETGECRTAAEDYEATPDNWITWSWPFWNTWLQAPETFTPYAPFGHKTCYPWVGYRIWVRVGAAADEGDPDQVTLIWPKPH